MNLTSISILTGTAFLLLSTGILAQQHAVRQLTFSDSTHDGYPAWSPDGKFIIYSSGTRSGCTTKRIPAEGGAPVQLTGYFSQHAQYSPDGSVIAFDGEFGTKVFVASSSGEAPRSVLPDSLVISKSGMPCWSPDGKLIAFRSQDGIWTVEPASGICTRIYQGGGNIVVPHCWTPDGSMILADLIDTVSRKRDIWMIPLKEGNARQLTFLGSYQANPTISPDGSMIVFASDHGGDFDLWVMSSSGGKPVQLTSEKGFDTEARWSPDGKSIAFSSRRTGYWAIWLMQPDLESIRTKLSQQ